MTDPVSCDILISGGGVAGLAAAAVFGDAGFRVICVDPAPPVTNATDAGADLRSTAFLQPARDLLERTGLWARLEPYAMPLEIMRIVDAGGAETQPRSIRDFVAGDISDRPFGWNLPNWLLRREMVSRLNDMSGVDFRPGIGTKTLFARTGGARVTLSDGAVVAARLVVAADGRNSPMRRAAGIDVTTRRYGQKALAFAVSHPIPHDNVSTEIHRTGGPFTLVPLPDQDGLPSSAVVWMESGPRATELAQMPVEDFEAEMTDRSCSLFGPLTLLSARSLWPIISQRANRMSAERLALMAEAAHVMPPIGAQGLNMSLADLSCLLDLAIARPDGLGDAQMLDAYDRARHGDVLLRSGGIDLLNRAAMARAQPLRDLRAAALYTLHGLKPLRHGLMHLGLGLRRK